MKAIGRHTVRIGGNEYSNSSLLRFFVRFSVRFFHFLHGFGVVSALLWRIRLTAIDGSAAHLHDLFENSAPIPNEGAPICKLFCRRTAEILSIANPRGSFQRNQVASS
jgi:hypothetical protein